MAPSLPRRGRASLPALLATATLIIACVGTQSPTPGDPSATPAASVISTPLETPFGTTLPGETPGPTTTPLPSASEPPTGTTYTVQPGDSLSAIARAWGTTVPQLQAWNGDRYPSLLTNPNVVHAGWVLIVSGDPNTTPLPTPSVTPVPATPAPTPVTSSCRAGNRVPAGGQQTFYTIPNAGHGVALTFDMGGRMDPAVEIMSFLVANRVCATIFATGVMSQTAEGRQVMAIIRDHPELFEIANHTMYHCDLARGGGGSPTTGPCETGGPPSADFIRQQMTDAEQILRDSTGQNPQPYWRPPYGSINQAVLDAVASVGYTKTFMWDIDTIDWKPTSQGGPTAQQIATKVITNARDGSNVLMHLGGFETLDALEIMVPGLRDRGFLLTSLSDLLN